MQRSETEDPGRAEGPDGLGRPMAWVSPSLNPRDIGGRDMQMEAWVASPEPAVGVFTPAGTCPGRLRRHYVIGYADPGQNPSAVRSGSSQVRGRGRGMARAARRCRADGGSQDQGAEVPGNAWVTVSAGATADSNGSDRRLSAAIVDSG